MKLILIFLFLLISARLTAPGREIIPEWKYVSFDIQDGRIVTEKGIYLRKLPDGFLVMERKRGNKYEIILRKFKPIFKYRRK